MFSTFEYQFRDPAYLDTQRDADMMSMLRASKGRSMAGPRGGVKPDRAKQRAQRRARKATRQHR